MLRALPPRVGWLLEWVGDVLGLACCLYFVWYGVGGAGRELSSGAISIKTLIMPEWWLLAPLPVALPAARDRVRVPHAPPGAAERGAARRRGVGVMTAVSGRRR